MRRCLRYLAPPLTSHVAPEACHTANAEAKAQADAWHVTPATHAAATAKAESLGYPDNVRITFLCAKGVKIGPQPYGAASSRFDLLVNPPDKHWHDRQDSLHGILGMPTKHVTKVKDYNAIPADISFDNFEERHPEWQASSGAFVFFRDHPKVCKKSVLIQREQIFGTCAIHAPVTLQHYLVAMHHQSAAPTLDIPSWMRKNASAAVLDGVLFGDGTSADVVLRRILVPSSLAVPYHFADIPKNLLLYGPGLLPWWGVASDFSKGWSHTGPAPTDTQRPGHSMLVVGHRTLGDGSTRLLLQNWWRNKQFVEVDEHYYASCMQSEVLFVHAPQPKIPFPDLSNAVFSVSATDGAGVSGIGAPTMMAK